MLEFQIKIKDYNLLLIKECDNIIMILKYTIFVRSFKKIKNCSL